MIHEWNYYPKTDSFLNITNRVKKGHLKEIGLKEILKLFIDRTLRDELQKSLMHHWNYQLKPYSLSNRTHRVIKGFSDMVNRYFKI